MPNPNPTTARQSKQRKKVAAGGDLTDLRAVLWDAVETAARSLNSSDEGTRLRAVHAVTQTAGAYTKLVEAVEIEHRLHAVESALGLAPS